VIKARLRAEPVSSKTSNGSKKMVKELPTFDMVCPNKNVQKSMLNLFSPDAPGESRVERNRVMSRAIPMLLRLHFDDVNKSGHTMQVDWLPLTVFAGEIVL
jgi:hypothetical protein